MGGLTDMTAWMAAIPNDRKLKHITMPGSHDAGVYTEASTKVGLGKVTPASWTACQDRPILDQCGAGSRFFDVRLKASSTSIRAHHTTKGHGAVGESWDSTLESVSAFLDAHPSEFVILRLTKPAGGAKDEIIEQLVKSSLKDDRLYRCSNFPNFANMNVGALRGKAICVFEPKSFSSLHPSFGLHPFYRYEEGATSGLITCGKYSKDKKIGKVIDGQVGKIDAHADHVGDHLFVLYWTQTGGNVESHTKELPSDKARQKQRVSGGSHANMDYLKVLLCTGQDIYTGREKFKVVATDTGDRRRVMPNVIMYDFVNPKTSTEIVSLNEPGLRAHLV